MPAVRIGITAHAAVEGDRDVASINEVYVDAVVCAGALPLVLPILDPAWAEAALDGIDGLLLSGGGDVEPARYGAVAVPEVGGVDPRRDAWELALARAAMARDVPILGVCRGSQLLNVACGGTLVQHLGDTTDQLHRDDPRSHEVAHAVAVAPDSVLARVLGTGRIGVNTLHHQAVADVAPGLRAVAWADDGTIEAVEGVHHRVLSVQWHPELLAGLVGHAALFDWLVATAGAARVDAADEPPAAELDARSAV
jgi:putative glutamine amidotransferase